MIDFKFLIWFNEWDVSAVSLNRIKALGVVGRIDKGPNLIKSR